MSEPVYVSTVGFLVGDSWLTLPRLILRCARSETHLVCGTYALPVFEFARNYIAGCDYTIDETLDDPDDGKHPWTPGFGFYAFVAAHQHLQGKYPGILRFDESTLGMDDSPSEYPLRLRKDLPQGDHVVVHGYTRHSWKNLDEILYRLRFRSPAFLVGRPDEPGGYIDLRNEPYEVQVLKTITARAIVGVNSSFTCLASVFLKRQIIVSFTPDVSYLLHNPNAITLVTPTLEGVQAVVDKEGL